MPSPVGTSPPWLSLVTLCIWLCSVTCKIFSPGSFPVCLIGSSLSSFCPLPFLIFIPKCWHHWGLSLSIFSLFGVPSIRKCSCYPELQIPVICDLSSPNFFFFFFPHYSLYLGSQQVSLVEWSFESGFVWALWWIQSAVKKIASQAILTTPQSLLLVRLQSFPFWTLLISSHQLRVLFVSSTMLGIGDIKRWSLHRNKSNT